jgi:hypothetical protein
MDLPKPVATTAAEDDHESILGQFIYAFGQGAGTVRVSRPAIAALRSRYLGPVRASACTWETTAAYVLPLLAQVGRLAALFATQAGRCAIAEADFTRARRLIESRTHEHAETSGQLMAGPFCPPVGGEADGASEPWLGDDAREGASQFTVRPHEETDFPADRSGSRSHAH